MIGIQMIELVDNAIKTITTIFHMSKKIEEILNVLSKDVVYKNPIQLLERKKYTS